MRVVLVSMVIDIIHDVWKMLAAAGVISDARSTFWHGCVLFPLAEGMMVLPAAIVVSVWMDVANSSMSRSKVGNFNAQPDSTAACCGILFARSLS